MQRYIRLLRLPEVMARTGRSRSSIYADIKNGTFPKSVGIGSRSVAWPENVINEWVEEKITASRSKYEQ